MAAIKEDKELLFIDLCSRLPYHIRLKVWLKDGTTEEGFLDLQHNYGDVLRDAFYYNKIVDIKPYLRPMSSMTEEEKREYDYRRECMFYDNAYDDAFAIDWLLARHFDFRNLIDKGLALEASNGMYNFKD